MLRGREGRGEAGGRQGQVHGCSRGREGRGSVTEKATGKGFSGKGPVS